MNIPLTPELEEFVRETVESGIYLSASEIELEALRKLHEHDQLRALQLDVLKRQIAEGVGDIVRSNATVLDAESIKARGRSALASRSKSQRNGSGKSKEERRSGFN